MQDWSYLQAHLLLVSRTLRTGILLPVPSFAEFIRLTFQSVHCFCAPCRSRSAEASNQAGMGPAVDYSTRALSAGSAAAAAAAETQSLSPLADAAAGFGEGLEGDAAELEGEEGAAWEAEGTRSSSNREWGSAVRVRQPSKFEAERLEAAKKRHKESISAAKVSVIRLIGWTLNQRCSRRSWGQGISLYCVNIIPTSWSSRLHCKGRCARVALSVILDMQRA